MYLFFLLKDNFEKWKKLEQNINNGINVRNCIMWHKSLKIVFPFFGFLYTQTPSVDVVRYSFCNKPRFKGSNKSSNFQFWSIYFQNFTNQNFTRFIHINRAKIFINRTKFTFVFQQPVIISINIFMYRWIY